MSFKIPVVTTGEQSGPDPDRLLRVHMNVPQLKVALIDAAITICMWGRATGKTEGPMAQKTLRNVHEMPRSTGALVGATYEQLLTRTLPPLLSSWRKYGYEEDVHYWIRKAPPAKLRVPDPFIKPLKHEHFIQLYNGSGIHLISQDRPGTGNGLSIQWLAGDEARLLNGQRLQEDMMPTLRGLMEHFGRLSCYLSILFCTDRPLTTKSNWLYQLYEGQHDEETIQAILALAVEAYQIRCDLDGISADGQVSGREVAPDPLAVLRLKQIEEWLVELRRDTVYWSEASTLDNIHALGPAPLKTFKRTLTDVGFQTSILNRKVISVENGFYPLLDEDHHGYFASNLAHLDSLQFSYKGGELPELDCRADADLQLHEVIDVALDYNNAINSLTCGQGQPGGKQYNVLQAMYVLNKDGKLLVDLINQFCRYYRFHRLKVVRYFYNNTAIARSASSNVSYKDLVVAAFRDNGWEVIEEYLGQASTHYSRYLLWNEVLDERNPNLPRLRFNRTRCAPLFVSMLQAGIKRAGDVFKKDKSSEDLKSGVEPQDATHLSEAMDDLLWGSQRHKLPDVGGRDSLPAIIG